MPRGKWIDKKTAQHFTLVHRPQNDPLIHDEKAPAMVLNPTQPKPGSSKVKHLDELASEFGSDAAAIRANEGEAASHGVYFDDTEYDYMQHLRDLNSASSGEVVFIEANTKSKGKQKESLEDALKKMDLEQKSGDLLDDEMLPSKNLTRVTYQAQQDVPDSIRGFQPDMDPRLREVLEALDDEAYVDDEDDEIFKNLTKDGQEINDDEFDGADFFDEDADGWESDDTAKPTKEYKEEVPELVAVPEHPEVGPSQDWMEDFKQFKKEQKSGKPRVAPSHSELQFDKIEESYLEDPEDDMASISHASTSSVVGPTRRDFDGILDDFLGSYTKPGKRTSKKSKAQTGLEQLEEIRRELGPPRIRGRNVGR
ncbi:low-temperature viability protein ltv1 [Metarhizium acridum CQMa 102]|uniref:Low-temperature viability protein ltv1 n=1 Tax=Metarhizium acridum (strain CQMa 102) TaxID=655827 RepID=E9DTC4_METAQ|nr:low-temperature viability protein ltv1 [Metarhizium acridum CQMa 102]EFY92979.1 low-temperature viability protein ltv1 [Metarhizium acridum CQMa 102]